MIRSKVPNKAYLDNYEKIFSKKSGNEIRVQGSESKKSEERIQSKDKAQG